MSATDPYYRPESGPISPEESFDALRVEANHRTADAVDRLDRALDSLQRLNVTAVPASELSEPNQVAQIYDFTSESDARQRVAASHIESQQQIGAQDVQKAA